MSTSIEQVRARNDRRMAMERDMAEQFPGGTSWQMMEMALDIAALLDVAEAARTTNHVYTPDGADSAACAICNALSRIGVRHEQPPNRPEPECPACEQPRGHAGDCIPSIGVIGSANPQ